ncbi:MAG: hypothetical protein ACR2QQ_13285 [Gammaproteobacteria bacterium]
MSSSTSHLKDLPIDTPALPETQSPRVRRFVEDGSPQKTAAEPAEKEQPDEALKPTSRKEKFINMPLWDFLIILTIFVAIGYVIGAAHQYAALT